MAYYLIFETFKLDLNTICHTTTKVGLTFPALVYANESSLKCNVFLLFTLVFIVSHQLRFKTILNIILTSSYRPLLDAVRCNREEIVTHLLNNGTDVNIQGDKGMTALHIAAEDRNYTLVDILLRFGADANIKDNNLNTALHMACAGGNIEIVFVLLKYSPDINIRNRFGETPLHLAVKYNHRDLVEVLLNRGSDLDIPDFCGETVLHYSIRENNRQIIDVLFQYGADITKSNKESFTAFDIAVQKTEEPIIRLLLPHLVLMKDITDIKQEFGELFESMKIETDLLGFLTECEEELKLLKKVKIPTTNVPYVEFLTCRVPLLAKYVRNALLIESLLSEECEVSFPIYIGIMRKRFEVAMRRRTLLELCHTKFVKEVRNDLPLLCIEKIFDFMKDFELVDFQSR